MARTHLRLRDLEPWTVYRLTVSGTVDSKLAARGPWLFAATHGDVRADTSRHPHYWAVPGPPALDRGLPLAGHEGRYGYTLDPDPIRHYLPMGRVAERVCALSEWHDWWTRHCAAEDASTTAATSLARAAESDTVWLVASLYALEYDLGGGRWDLGNEWARYVSHVVDMLPNQRHLTSLTMLAYADAFTRRVHGDTVNDYRAAAERWLHARIADTPTQTGTDDD